MNERREIYKFVEQRGKPCELPGLWKSLPCHPAFIKSVDDPGALLAELQAAFDTLQLLDAGIVQIDGQGIAQLNPLLAKVGSVILPLRESPSSPPYDLLSGPGTTVREAWPFFTVLSDYRLGEIDQNRRQLLAVSSLDDMALCWSLGLPALPIYGLESLSGKALDAFCKALRLPRPPNQRWSSELPVDLVLVNWSPSRLNLEAGIGSVCQHLTNLQTNLGICMDDCQLWRPSESEIEVVRFRIQHGNRSDIEEAMLESLANSSRPLIEPADPRGLGPQCYSAAVQEWISAQGESTDVLKQRTAWNRLQELQESQVIQPLIARAQETNDPLEQSRLLAVADVSRLLHNQSLLLSMKFATSVRDEGGNAPPAFSKHEFQQVMTLADRVAGLLTPSRTSRQRRPSRPIQRSQPTSTRHSSPGSARNGSQ